METNWASDHLQTIRTLMERAALYRRALAPLMMTSGSMGIAAFIVTRLTSLDSARAFSAFWLSISCVAITLSYVMVRRQALKDSEPFWSPPTRRVTEALLPAFFVGFAAGVYHLVREASATAWLLAPGWIIVYGCAVHAAGFFMQNRMRFFGWVFVLGGCALLFAAAFVPELRTMQAAHVMMGLFFGVLHAVCGIYLYFTEQRRKAS
jgi:hypothetical protein